VFLLVLEGNDRSKINRFRSLELPKTFNDYSLLEKLHKRTD
jgi:hypothetical protein